MISFVCKWGGLRPPPPGNFCSQTELSVPSLLELSDQQQIGRLAPCFADAGVQTSGIYAPVVLGYAAGSSSSNAVPCNVATQTDLMQMHFQLLDLMAQEAAQGQEEAGTDDVTVQFDLQLSIQESWECEWMRAEDHRPS